MLEDCIYTMSSFFQGGSNVFNIVGCTLFDLSTYCNVQIQLWIWNM